MSVSSSSSTTSFQSLTARENVALVTELVEHPMTPEDASRWWVSASGSIIFPLSCREVNNSAWQLPGPLPTAARALCDEPTGALDITTGVVVSSARACEPRTRNSDCGHHPQRRYCRMADRVVRLADGKIGGSETNVRKIAARELQW
jgi:putative ABC transport system ATP-binding protein